MPEQAAEDQAKQPVLVFRCDHCNRVAAELRDGKLVLFQRHDNDYHQTIITLSSATAQSLSQAGQSSGGTA